MRRRYARVVGRRKQKSQARPRAQPQPQPHPPAASFPSSAFELSPPVVRPERIPSFPAVTGNGFRALCRWVLDEHGWRENPLSENPNWFFAKIDRVRDFFRDHRPQQPYVLVTHNGDNPAPGPAVQHLDDPLLIRWFAANVSRSHPKLTAIPGGLTNKPMATPEQCCEPRCRYEFVDESLAGKTAAKDNLVVATYSPINNNTERLRCLRETGVPILGNPRGDGLHGRLPHEEYIPVLRRTLFTISPEGAGVDCVRHWEALYARSIPIVTDSAVTRQLSSLFPMLVLPDWSAYKSADLSHETYERLWGDFDVAALAFDRAFAAVIARALV